MIPPVDPSGVLIAVLSAALFTLAIFFVVRSRQSRTEIETPLTAMAFASDWLPMARSLFADVLMERRNPAVGLVISVGLHLTVLASIPLLSYLFPAELRFDFRRYQVKVVEFRVPRPLVYEGEEKPPLARVTPRPRAVAGPGALRTAEAASPAAKLQPFRLAASPKARHREVVLQPDQPPEIAVVLPHSLPAAFVWAQAPAPPRESQVLGAANPGLRPTPALPQAVALLQPPNLEINIADLQIASRLPLTFHAPNLPVPPANVSPLTAAEGARGELSPTAMPGGEPLNLVAMTQSLSPFLNAFLVDLGNRLAAAAAGAGAGAAGGEAGGAPGASGSGTGVGSGAGAANLLAAAAGGGNGGTEGSGSTSEANRVSAPGAATGHLGVVVVQQSAAESSLEGSEVLTGQPVYTVFFEVPGSPRRWMLQYCVPGARLGASVVQTEEGRVRVIPRKTVQPPYPVERLPVDTRGFKGDLPRVVVYAMVDEKGEATNLRLVHGTGQEVDKAVLATLRNWAFRPARLGDEPVAVEALFGIPLQ